MHKGCGLIFVIHRHILQQALRQFKSPHRKMRKVYSDHIIFCPKQHRFYWAARDFVLFI